MGVAMYVVPERRTEDGFPLVDRAELGHGDGLDRIAMAAGVRPLMDFFSATPEAASLLFATEHVDRPSGGFPPERWFDADEGLRTVRAVRDYLRRNPAAVRAPVMVGRELAEVETALERLAEAGVRWHLGIQH